MESFQREFAFAITGIVDEPTWAALVITYLSLASDEGENDLPEGEYPGFVLAIGSAGPSVRRLQRYMNGIAPASAWPGSCPKAVFSTRLRSMP